MAHEKRKNPRDQNEQGQVRHEKPGERQDPNRDDRNQDREQHGDQRQERRSDQGLGR